jgi:nitrate/nitrite transport system permease protein
MKLMTAAPALKIVGQAPDETTITMIEKPLSTENTAIAEVSSNKITTLVARIKVPSAKQAFDGLWPPILGISSFVGLWAVLAPQVQTSLGALPGPGEVWTQFVALMSEHAAARQEAAQVVAAGGAWSGAPTFVDQIYTSLQTVALGFVMATAIAVPLGLVAGMSKRVNAALNPLIQVMRPISPLAWLPIVTMVVSASITSADPLFAKSFVISAITVMLCSLWQTLINTAVGVASIDKDLLNVGKVLRLSWFAKLTKLVLPSAMPYIFTGMRLSLGVGWMVLIAAEMLAQNPGLGKFVWDEFQNSNDRSLARIMVAVVVIGLIGFALDRVMGMAQAVVAKRMGR